jgi:1-acyl-sn-glycerol-3-phosphate acyltransferase
MGMRFVRFLIRFLLRTFARVEVRGRENIPQGNYVIAANHLGLVDAFMPFFIIDNENIVVLVGEKWEKLWILRWLGKQLNFLFIDRFNPDLKAIRAVMRRMEQGDILVITPEGTRSKVGHLIEGKQGVSYLAVKLGLPILPVCVYGSFDPIFFGQLKRLKRPQVTVNIGPPFSLAPYNNRERDAVLQRYTDEIMCRIAALMPAEYRGFYAEHPRLKELLAGK